MFLLLCGDIEPNPGDVTCPYCSETVSDSDRAMCCDLCNCWVHVSCDPAISVAEYDALVSNPSDMCWYCSRCFCVINCVYFNTSGIVSRKLDLLAYLSVHQVDVLGISESFLDSSVLDSEVCPPGFVIFRRDRDRHGGGVMVLVRENFIVHRCPDLETSCELLWIELSTKKGPLLFGVYYRPPKSDVSMLQELNSSLQLLPACSKVVLCGDFNAPHIDWSLITSVKSTPVNTQLCSIVNDNFLTQFVSEPTCQNHILDLVFFQSASHFV